MTAILVIRPSSLGDVVHALAVVADVRAHRPELALDWVAEEAFVPLVGLHPGVRRTIPVALRRWRRQLLAAAAWREFAAFRADLRRERYAAVIDLQEQIKGSLLAAMARGPSHGPGVRGAREPLAALWHDVRHPVPRRQHFQDRCRQLVGAALGYTVDGPPRFGLVPPLPERGLAPAGPYALLVHGTSRDDKLWPEAHWRTLATQLGQAGIGALLPWGSEAERVRSERIAAGVATARVLPRSGLPALAGLLRGAEVVVGVDTGLVHLAAALGTPTVALFVATDPAQAGVERASPHARDLGRAGQAPDPADAWAAAGALLRQSPRC
ncbi:MAG: lipopolysaccharide heptosyltransferase I [Betaproteobacteria bacterium]|nr:lipopolysaccharide heptosyltransferase I [Betaproteobacteria bacterium]